MQKLMFRVLTRFGKAGEEMLGMLVRKFLGSRKLYQQKASRNSDP